MSRDYYTTLGVARDASADDILDFCREEGLHGYMLPAMVEFFPELPRHIDGKIIKRELEKLYWKDAERKG